MEPVTTKTGVFVMSVSRIPIRLVVDGVDTAEAELIRIRSPRTTDAIIRGLIERFGGRGLGIGGCSKYSPRDGYVVYCCIP